MARWRKNRKALSSEMTNFYNNIENTTFFDGPEVIARRKTDLVWGNGFTLASSNEKIQDFLNEFIDFNDFETLGRTITHWMSKQGRVVAFINKTKGDKWYLELADPQMTNKVAYVNQREQLAVIYTRPFRDNKNWILKTTITDKTLTRTIIDESRKGQEQEITLDTANEKLPKEEQIQAEWKHNLGFLPLVEFKNKRMLPINWQTQAQRTDFSELSDTKPVEYINNLINVMMREKTKHAIIEHSRAFGKFGPQEIKKITESQSTAFSYMTDQLLIEAKAYGKEGAGNSVETISPTLAFGEYDTGTTQAISQYFNGAGLNSPFQAQGFQGGQQDTATGVLALREMDYTTITDSRRMFQEIFTKLMDKLLVAANLMKDINPSSREYSFDLSNDLPMSPLQKLEMIRQRMELGLITRKEAAQELKSNLDEAEINVYLNDLEMDEQLNQAKAQAQGGDMFGDMGGQQGQPLNQTPDTGGSFNNG